MNNSTAAIADKAYDTLTDAAYCACLLDELFTLAQGSADPSCALSDCALGGLAAINRHIFQTVLKGRNLYHELIRENAKGVSNEPD
jgi:hypothetical protein